MYEGPQGRSIYDRREHFLRLLRPSLLWVPMLICVAGSALLKFGISPHQFEGTETLANAVIARELTRGQGFKTRILTPLSLGYTNVEGRAAPDVEYPPLFPIVLAVTAFPFRQTPGTACTITLLLHLLIATSIFVWVNKLSRDIRAACMATAVYGLAPVALEAAISGAAITLATLVVANLVFWLLWLVVPPQSPSYSWDAPPKSRTPSRRDWIMYLGAGIVAGLAILADYRMIFLVAFVALYIWRAGDVRRLKPALLFFCGALVTLIPWMVRNAHITGSPFFSLYWGRALIATQTFPGLSFYCRELSTGETVASVMSQYKFDILTRLFNMAIINLSNLPGQLGTATAALVVLGYCARILPRGAAKITLVLCAVLWLTASIWAITPLASLVVLPMLAYVGGLTWATAMDKLSPAPPQPGDSDVVIIAPRGPIVYHTLAFYVLAVVAMVSAAPWRPQPVPSLRDVAVLNSLMDKATDRPTHCILTDVPWDLAWYTGDTCCALPTRPEVVPQINARIPCEIIALSSAFSELKPESYLSAWHYIVTKETMLPGYNLVHRSPLALLWVHSSVPAPSGARKPAAPGHAAPGAK